MRSRRDDIDHAAAVERALARGVVGMGQATDPSAERRVDRLAAAPDGSFVWTRHPDGRTFVGRIVGPLRHDADGAEVDLVNVRDCDWVAEPVNGALIPAAVAQTFARGGRNWQQTHPGNVAEQTELLWERLNS